MLHDQQNPLHGNSVVGMPFSSTDTAVPGFEPMHMIQMTPDSLHTLSSFWRKTVMQQTHHNLFPELVASLSYTLKMMANLDVDRAPGISTSPGFEPEVAGLVDICGPTERLFILSFPESTAFAITQRIAGNNQNCESDELVSDCIAELTNITVGRALSALNRDHLKNVFPTRATISGSRSEVRWGNDSHIATSRFSCELGHFHMQLLSRNSKSNS